MRNIEKRGQHFSVRPLAKATITRCDLSPRFFCIDVKLLFEFESDKRYESTSLNRIVADKSHRVIIVA